MVGHYKPMISKVFMKNCSMYRGDFPYLAILAHFSVDTFEMFLLDEIALGISPNNLLSINGGRF